MKTNAGATLKKVVTPMPQRRFAALWTLNHRKPLQFMMFFTLLTTKDIKKIDLWPQAVRRKDEIGVSLWQEFHHRLVNEVFMTGYLQFGSTEQQ